MTIIQGSFNNNVKNSQYSKTTNSRQRQNSNISFGYDEKLSKRVRINANFADLKEITELQKICNSVEDVIRSRETLPEMDDAVFFDVSTLLIPLKATLAQLVDTYFPTLNYSRIESGHYFKEAGIYDDKKVFYAARWRNDVGAAIEEVRLENTGKNSKVASSEQANKTSVNAANNVENINQKKKNSIIKMFVPNEYTPKGFADVAGMEDIKKELQNWIIDPIKDPKINRIRQQYGIKLPNGFMLYGPPGCGKTFIAEALAVEADIPLFKLKISEAGSSYIHKTSENYRLAFEEVEKKAKELKKPCILFIDEIDGLASSRELLGGDNDFKVEEINTLLDQLNDASARGIIVMAATNNPGGVDKAIKRSGRFDKDLYVGLPDDQARLSKIKLDLARRLKAQDLISNEEELSKIVNETDGFSNSDINAILESAAMKAMDKRKEISLKDVLESINESEIKKLSENDLKKYSVEPIKERRIGFYREDS